MEGALAPWHLIVLGIVVIAMFGSRRLPESARALGQSLRILRAETRGLTTSEPARFDVYTGQPLPEADPLRGDPPGPA